MIQVQWNGSLNPVGTAANKNTAAASSTSFQSVMSKAVSAPANLEEIFSQAAQKYNVPENLLKAVAKVESNFQANATSRCGAAGIMQLMPSTAKGLGVTDLYDPKQNIMGGAKELSQLLKRYNGDLKLTLAGYNAGIGNVAKYGGVPPFAETQAYVKKVMQYTGQDLTIPKSTASTASGAGANTKVSTSQEKESGIQPGTNINLRDVLFGNPDEDYTYEDYQLFLEMYLTQIRMEANGINTESGDSGAMFWL